MRGLTCHVNVLGLRQVEDEEDLKQKIEVVRFMLYVCYSDSWLQGEFEHRRAKAGGQIGGYVVVQDKALKGGDSKILRDSD